MKRKLVLLLLLITSILLVSGCNSTLFSSRSNVPDIQVSDAWARAAGASAADATATPTGDMKSGEGSMGDGMSGPTGAAYLTIRNNGNSSDRLLQVQSDVAASVELHTVEMKDGVMSMFPVDGIDIPAKGEIVLKPGGYHIMLIGLMKELKPGDHFSVTLHFSKAGNVETQVEVRQP